MSAKKIFSLVLGLSSLALSALAGETPKGNLIEVNSCEIYAGGCTVSCEAQLCGRQHLQVWDITSGEWQGVNLKGLQAAVLKLSDRKNLTVAGAQADQAVVYLPESATAAQRDALVAWMKSRDTKLAALKLQTRVVPISMANNVDGTTFTAGSFISFKATSLGDCDTRACGEDLWYKPSVSTSYFTVGLNASSKISEPLLKLTWNDHNSRSIFLARFGDEAKYKNLYVQTSDWCAAGTSLF